MTHCRANPNQLVLRRDSATGFAKVGWAIDMPRGRFVHIEVICECDHCAPVTQDSPLFTDYRRACQKANELNQPLLSRQEESCRAKGWLPVPLDLNQQNVETGPDEFGSYQSAAMRKMFQLTANTANVWAVVQDGEVTFIHARRPPRQMEELEYQVWKQHTLNRIGRLPGEISRGKLVIRETGLWFCPDI